MRSIGVEACLASFDRLRTPGDPYKKESRTESNLVEKRRKKRQTIDIGFTVLAAGDPLQSL